MPSLSDMFVNYKNILIGMNQEYKDHVIPVVTKPIFNIG